MDIKIFTNANWGEIRIAQNEKNEVFFCLSDVCKILALANPSMVKCRLDEAGCDTHDHRKGTTTLPTDFLA